MHGRVTIAELARHSGVSKGTVSRALNGYRDVSPATRERIVRLARELGYEPDAAARSLKTRRTMLAGAYLGACSGDRPGAQPFFRAVLAGLSERLGAGVPEDVSVVGFDDLPLAALVQPELTTVRQDPALAGAAAAEALIARIEGGAGRRTTIPVELMVRASTAPQSVA